MSIIFEKYNGENSNIDYDNLEKSIKHAFPRVSKMKIFLLNKFPIQISSEIGIDLLMIISIDSSEENNYHFIKKLEDDTKVYLYNLIIPITFINQYKNEIIFKNSDSNELICADEYLDFESEIKLLQYNLKEYLVEKLQYEEKDLRIHPIFFIRNNNKNFSKNVICNKTFSFNDLNDYFKKCDYNYFCSYKNWKDKIAYNNLENSIKKIIEKAGSHSKYGYLTKKKLNLLIKDSSKNILEIKDNISANLILIKGKAGSGKTSALIKLLKDELIRNNRCIYLTYNKLLTYEVSSIINTFRYQNKNLNFELPTVITLSQYFYRLCKSFGITLIINEDRINELTTKFNDNFKILTQVDFFQPNYAINRKESILELIQNSALQENVKQEGIDFLHFIRNNKFNKIKSEDIKLDTIKLFNIEELLKDFSKYKIEVIKSLFKDKKVFLKDYNNCLIKLYENIENPKKFFKDNNLKDKYELLKPIIDSNHNQNRKNQYLKEENGKIVLNEEKYETFANRRIGKYSGGKFNKKILFIDEGQDCLTYEKLILFKMFGYSNLVVSSGEKEQLIRRSEICNWNIEKGKKIENYYEKTISSKSLRIKKNILDFCIAFSKNYNIDYKADAMNGDDIGEVIVSFSDIKPEFIIEKIQSGERMECSVFESSLILLESSSLKTATFNEFEVNVNHLDNVIETKSKKKVSWELKESIEKKDFQFWDGINKKPNLPPYQNEIRLILYESCRGLEAWTTFCLSADKFFNRKKDSDDADRHLLNEKTDIFISEEMRKKRYAATCLLLGFTRAINTLFIEIKSKDSELGQFILNYQKENPLKIKIIH